MKKISIVIVTYNSEDLIGQCLDSIFNNNDLGEELEVIVVDNRSKNVNRMFSSLKNKYGERVLLIKNNKNGGYGQGNNVGILQASAPIIMIMNPDVILISPIFKRVISYFSDMSVAMIGMRQLVSKDKAGVSFSVKLNFIPIISVLLNFLCNKIQWYIQPLMYFAGACFFIRKSAFKKIGLFDENIFMYGEENDVHHRLLSSANNVKFIYDKNLKYVHLIDDRPLSNGAIPKMIRSNLLFCEKNKIDKRKTLKYKILDEKTWIIIEKMRNNKTKIEYHKTYLKILNQALLSL
ncbi:glycosyltransferase family 2 protein [Parabacteroides sp. Marseille-P3160]|uniref:glycosyltransferase family 2 protein n=1 Tax=Parabacteroides sp. Marseille-P3160 TaxID=1917887 RepID=UPI0013570A75|nr:glycosyltransferase family 2 protein [Parabacteroides sp. Marseille-P3160]